MKHDLKVINAAIALGDNVVFPKGTCLFLENLTTFGLIWDMSYMYQGCAYIEIMGLDITNIYETDLYYSVMDGEDVSVVYKCRLRIPTTRLRCTYGIRGKHKWVRRRKLYRTIIFSDFVGNISKVLSIPDGAPPFAQWCRMYRRM